MTYELTVQRLIDAPPSEVFDAFVDPAAQVVLYGDETDPPDWEVSSELDLRVGGTWTITFGKANKEPYRETNVFTEVDRPGRLVFHSNLFMVDDGHHVRTRVTVTFGASEGKTLMTIHQTGFEREEDRDGIESGWSSILDALGRVVATRRREAPR
jgi:uncharacterized protein YndB with AHSA1/START domain